MAVKKSRPKGATVKKSASPTKAQLEFDRHKAKYEAAQAERGDAPGQGSAMPPPFAAAYAYVPQGGPYYGPVRWGLPPSMAPLPVTPGTGVPLPGIPVGAGVTTGPLGDRLGSTLRQGIEVLNAGLAGGLRFLSGLSSAAYPSGGWDAPYADYPCAEAAHGQCHVHDCCDCCHTHHAACGCQPSVGNCCC